MKRMIFTLLKQLVADLKIGFMNWFFIDFFDLRNAISSAPLTMGEYFHSGVCPMLSNI